MQQQNKYRIHFEKSGFEAINYYVWACRFEKQGEVGVFYKDSLLKGSEIIIYTVNLIDNRVELMEENNHLNHQITKNVLTDFISKVDNDKEYYSHMGTLSYSGEILDLIKEGKRSLERLIYIVEKEGIY